ncbi:MAG: PQQ-like beta-propeller repeat protein [Planctomycetes bacterium]|nr:PQQ-like beta-propeller repeat protein [Planctomycetota bacterium]
MPEDSPQDAGPQSDVPQSDAAQAGAPARPPAWNKTRRWLPVGLIAVEALALVALQYAENAEWLPGAEAFLAKFSVVGLGTILLFLWFVFLAPASPTLRRRVGIVGLVLVVATVATVRVEGVSGDIHFRFNWRWAPRADETLPSAASQAAANANVDLAETTPDDYPQYLGPDRIATLKDVHLARDWSADPPKLLWRQPIGAGWSGFAVVGHYGVTQEQRGDEELITCYDIDTGKLQWGHVTPVRFHEIAAGIGPRATPTIDEGRVYAMGAMGHLSCLDGATGKPLWEHDVVTETDAIVPQWGKSCSPLVYENLVIVSAGGPNGKSLVAYDKHDGRLVWSAGDDASSYSSPTVMTLCGVPQIVMIGETVTTGHDPADGRILWQHVWPEHGVASPNIAQPIAVGDDRILLSKGYGVGSELWQISREADRWSVEPIWRKNTLKIKMTNAVIRDRFAYGLDEGTLACIEIDTGRRKWKRGRFGHGQVLLVDDLLLVQSERGEVALVEATPEGYRELSRMTVVDGQSWNCPALSGRRLLVRTDLEAACYELPVVSP